MNRQALMQFIEEQYGAAAEYLWAKYPTYAAFRRHDNKKWFALVMDVPRSKLGMKGEGAIDILDVKCDPIAIGSLRQEPGFYPAYHMNKASWVTAVLDGTVGEEKLKWLLDVSYALAGGKGGKR